MILCLEQAGNFPLGMAQERNPVKKSTFWGGIFLKRGRIGSFPLFQELEIGVEPTGKVLEQANNHDEMISKRNSSK